MSQKICVETMAGTPHEYIIVSLYNNTVRNVNTFSEALENM